MRNAPNSISGILDSKFWTIVVPRLSSSWSSVRYGIVALSALIRSRATSINRHDGTADEKALPTHPLVLSGAKFYGKAIAITRDELSRSRNGDVAALTCIIFFCIECIQGHYSNALTFFRHGHKVVQDVQRSQADAYYDYGELSSAVDRMFARIRLAACLTGGYVFTKQLSPSPRPPYSREPFANVCETRRFLFEISTDTYNFHLRASQGELCDEIGDLAPGVTEAQMELQTRLEEWRQRSTNFLSTTACTSPYDHLASLILSCHYLLNVIWLDCALTATELSFDDHTISFERIVSYAATIIRLKSAAQQTYSLSPFQLETGVLLPLYVASCKCRCPVLRRQALGWLRKGPTQEGFLERDRLVRTSCRVIELETPSGDGIDWPDESSRIIHSHVEPILISTGGRREFQVSFSRRDSDRTRITWDEWLKY